MLTDAERQELSSGRDRLGQAVAALRAQVGKPGGPTDARMADVEVFFDAVDRNLRQNLFFTKQNVDQARACLVEGTARAAALKEGKAPWERQTGIVVLGHRSAVDGSAQPYQVSVPADYDFAHPAPQRVDIFLHGRGGTLNELSFLRGSGWVRSSFGTDTLPYLALYPYGRGNNGWRWAGERDLFEALADCRRRYPVDTNRVLLRGFSMGGHGTWHIGLQHPGDWAAMSPGAGFIDTVQYQKITAPLPAWQADLLHMYDPIDYAANAANLPLLPYCGDQDPAMAQHQLIYAALRREGVTFRDYVGPNTPHRYEPATLQTILGELAHVRREPGAARVRFVTYTLRWSHCKWVHVEGLERHWDRAEVTASFDPARIEVKTRNVSALRLTPPGPLGEVDIHIDGQSVGAVGPTFSLQKRGTIWALDKPEGLRKRPGLQGPIDDALFGPVVAVSGTGTAWSEPAAQWTAKELQRFRDGWGEYLRANLPERTDKTLTPEDVKGKNLYLFGDPGSNAVLRRILPQLPLQWTRETITIAGQSFSTRDHLPMLVFPNPENPERYVVINTGFTFSRKDWNGSNANQYPHLPDYAVIRLNADGFADERWKDTELAGFFNEQWQLGGR